jgi:isopenicillin-N epimerase
METVEHFWEGVNEHTKAIFLSHITAPTALIMPLKEICARAREQGILTVIDGAHAPGQIPLDVAGLGADIYVANLHKWSFAAKGCGVLWRAPECPRAVRPLVVSHGLGQGFTAEFDYCGTRDYSPWLAVPAAFDYLESLDPGAMRAHNHALSREAARMLCDAWGTQATAREEFMAAMVSVRLPGDFAADVSAARRLAFDLADRHGVTVAVALLEGSLWIRVSAQIYNELSDIERLLDAIHSSRR